MLDSVGFMAKLLILPGLDGTDVFFRPLMASLPASIQPTVVTYPQTGRTYDDLLRLVRRHVADVGPCYVLGSSFSGPLALMLAREEPDNVRGIILSATFLRSPRRRLTQLRFAMVGPVIWTVRAVRRLPVWVLRPRDDAFRRAKAETWARVSAGVLAARARAVADVDVRDVIQGCRQAILCVAFEQDSVVPRANAEEILRLCPSAQLVVLPGSHLAMHFDPVSLAESLARFIGPLEGFPSDPR